MNIVAVQRSSDAGENQFDSCCCEIVAAVDLASEDRVSAASAANSSGFTDELEFPTHELETRCGILCDECSSKAALKLQTAGPILVFAVVHSGSRTDGRGLESRRSDSSFDFAL